MLYLVIYVVVAIGAWKVFEKAGKPGWAGIVPFYNAWIGTTEIVGRPWWWFVLLFVPLANIVVAVILCIDLAKSFGKDVVFGVLTFFFGFVMIPILGFGDAKYGGPSAPAA